MEPGLLKSADWPILIDIYFFLGGIAGGAFVVATIAGFLDGPSTPLGAGHRYRDVVRTGYWVALFAILPCPVLLIIDLGLPSRFLNMLMVSKPSTAIGMSAVTAGPLHFKPYSPMSAGAWGLMVFSTCAFVCAAETWLTDRKGRAFPRLRAIAGIVGAVAGFFLAAYPGVLLGATARPLFISAHWLGALFLAVGAATGSAAIALVLGWRHGSAAQAALARVMTVASVALIIQSVALALFIVSVRSAGSAGVDAALSQLLTGSQSVPFWLGAVLFGTVLPLLLQLRVIGDRVEQSVRLKADTTSMTIVRAALVLAGGFLIKFVLLEAGQAPLNGLG
jgi:formate-dependent nitrite reductase membrane component NrfD